MAITTVCRSAVPNKTTKRPTSGRFLETLGGRLAMQGIAWGGATRVLANERFMDQLADPHNLMTATAVSGLVGVASVITADKMEEESYLWWTPEVESINGRLAMIGIIAALAFNI